MFGVEVFMVKGFRVQKLTGLEAVGYPTWEVRGT